MDTDQTPMILLSGLAADAGVFAPQKIAFPHLTVPAWPPPNEGDTLVTYSRRLAADLSENLQGQRPIIGGASFGGIVAVHLAQHLNPRGIILIGSIRSSSELPLRIRILRFMRPMIRFIPVRVLQMGCAPAVSRFALKFAPHLSGLVRQFRGSDPSVFKWSLERILDWDEAPQQINCPVFQIHGDRDFVLPADLTSPDRVILGGGHVISLTHPSEVNTFIRESLSKIM